jgi:menaquinone-dependent protoporphyrinogen oxidase
MHKGKSQREVQEFLKRSASALNTMPAAFFSVSLTEAATLPVDRAVVQPIIDKFLVETGWLPTLRASFAGALKYRRYNFLIRFVMKKIAGQQGGDTDTSRDYEYTDWAAVDQFAARIDSLARQPAAAH